MFKIIYSFGHLRYAFPMVIWKVRKNNCLEFIQWQKDFPLCLGDHVQVRVVISPHTEPSTGLHRWAIVSTRKLIKSCRFQLFMQKNEAY